MLIIRRARRQHRGGDDRGLTLVELLISMGVFVVVIVLATVVLRGLTDATVRVTSTNSARTEADRLYNRLDKQVPYAAAINAAGQVNGSWWIEFRTDVEVGGSPPRCWQYRLNTAAQVVQVRSWPIGNGAGVSPWVTLLDDATVRTGTGAPPPFRLVRSTADVPRQRLVVAIDLARTGAPPVPLDTTYVARNTNSTTLTNTTGAAVCQEVGRS